MQRGIITVLTRCSFGLEKNGVCDSLLCKFRCMQEAAPEGLVKVGIHLCPRNTEYEPKSKHERMIVNG